MLQPPSRQRAPGNKRMTMPSRTCDPMILAFLNEQQALYQTTRRAREALSIVLRVVALAVAPPSRVVNMVDGHEDEEMTLLREDDSRCLLISI